MCVLVPACLLVSVWVYWCYSTCDEERQTGGRELHYLPPMVTNAISQYAIFSFSCLIHNETQHELDLFMFVCLSHPSKWRWPTRQCHSHWFYLWHCHWRDSEVPRQYNGQKGGDYDIVIINFENLAFPLKNSLIEACQNCIHVISCGDWMGFMCMHLSEEQGLSFLISSAIEKHENMKRAHGHAQSYLCVSASGISCMWWVSLPIPCSSPYAQLWDSH